MDPESFYYPDYDVAEKLGISRRCVWLWTRQGKLPAPHRLTRRATRWYWPEVVAFLSKGRGVPQGAA